MKKVRGYSVQTDELELEIQRLCSAKNVVIQYDESSSELHAYIQKPNINVISKIYELLRNELPSYSVPSKITIVDKDLATVDPVSGKRQRKTLVVNSLADLWQSETGQVPKPNDDFFVMGGDSLGAVLLLEKINELFSTELRIDDIYRNSTFDALEARILGAKQTAALRLKEDAGEVISKHQIHSL